MNENEEEKEEEEEDRKEMLNLMVNGNAVAKEGFDKNIYIVYINIYRHLNRVENLMDKFECNFVFQINKEMWHCVQIEEKIHIFYLDAVAISSQQVIFIYSFFIDSISAYF